MGLFDSIEGEITGALSGGGKGGMLEALMALINSPKIGGVQGLISTLKDKGLAGAVESWIGSGTNQPITGEQLQSALGSEPLQAAAQKLGVSVPEAADGLAKFLPQIIDKLAPDGHLPEGGMLEKGLSLLGKL